MDQLYGIVVLAAILAGTWAVWGPKVMLGVIATVTAVPVVLMLAGVIWIELNR